MLQECTIHPFSQLVYLDPPGGTRGGVLTVGDLSGYYTNDPVGRAHLKTRFGSIAQEYDAWKTFLREQLNDVWEFHITDVMDDNGPKGTGFFACTYRSPGGELVAAFRGSEMLGNRRYRNDYVSDFALSYDRQTPQQKMAEQYLATIQAFSERDYCLTGHSLGGNLALYAAVRAPDPGRLIGCYAFNAPGFNGEMIAENKQRIAAVKRKLYALQNQHDIVSSLLLDLCDPIVIESRFHPSDRTNPGVEEMLYPHSNYVFQEESGRFVRVQPGEKDALCKAVSRLTGMFLRLPRTVKKTVCDMVLDGIYSTQPPRKQIGFLLERITNYLVRQGVDGEQLELGAGLFWARHTAGEQTAAELYQRVYSGEPDARREIAQAAVLLFELLRAGCVGGGCPEKEILPA